MKAAVKERMRAAQVLLQMLRHTDFRHEFAARQGEVRFVIVLPDDSVADAFAAVGVEQASFLVVPTVQQGDSARDGMTVVHVAPAATGKTDTNEADCPIHPRSTVGMLISYLRTQRGRVTCRVATPDLEMHLLSDDADGLPIC
jgi:hypothetical protein